MAKELKYAALQSEGLGNGKYVLTGNIRDRGYCHSDLTCRWLRNFRRAQATRHIEFSCERVSRLGPSVQFLIAITDQSEFSDEAANDIAHAAANQNRLVVLVSNSGRTGQLCWTEFLDVMGGAVPSWRTLTDEYREHLLTASKNVLPPGLTGEAWWIFESLVANGLEFCFARRVNRMGGQKRGKRVSDMVAPLPDFSVIVVDAKASGSGFDVGAGSLRALVEYVEKQKQRQLRPQVVTEHRSRLLCVSLRTLHLRVILFRSLPLNFQLSTVDLSPIIAPRELLPSRL